MSKDRKDDDQEEEELEQYKQEANLLKEKGNQCFSSGEVQQAILLFSQALDLDPDNHVLYSNRSAAHMKADNKSKALYDAEKCVQLAPQWAKGYSRLGAAQQSLRRFDAAQDSYKKGIELDPSNKALWAALKACQEAHEADKKMRFAAAQKEREVDEERRKRRDEIRQEMLQEKQQVEQEDLLSSFLAEVKEKKEPEVAIEHDTPLAVEDDLLADFFTEVTTTNVPQKKPIVHVDNNEEEHGEKDDEDKIMTEKYAKQDLGDGKIQCERLLSSHHEWKNLNPFYVLELDIDATLEDIKFRYKKLSLKVHPDRLRDIPNARQAFEYVKEAYNRLLDPDQRRTVSMHIENVTTDLKRERKRLLAKGIAESDLPNYDDERKRLLMKHFADLEQMRRLSDKNRRNYSAREQMQEKELEEKLTKFNEFDKEWSEENRREKRVGGWRDFQTDPTAKRAKPANFKEEVRQETKHGVVKLEEWKKKWK